MIQTILYYLGQITKIGEKIMERKKEGYYGGFDRWLGLKEKVSAWKQQSKTDEDPNPSLINEIL